MNVIVERDGPVTTLIINRPEVRNAVDRGTAEQLAAAFQAAGGKRAGYDAEPPTALFPLSTTSEFRHPVLYWSAQRMVRG